MIRRVETDDERMLASTNGLRATSSSTSSVIVSTGSPPPTECRTRTT
jgi:hypothetical protein